MEQKIGAIVAQHLPGTNARIQFEEAIPSMPPSQANLALLKQYSTASEILGYGTVKPLDPGLRGAGDISHVATYVSASLAGLGPIGYNAHSERETLELNSLAMQTERATLLMYQLLTNN